MAPSTSAPSRPSDPGVLIATGLAHNIEHLARSLRSTDRADAGSIESALADMRASLALLAGILGFPETEPDFVEEATDEVRPEDHSAPGLYL